MAIQQDSAINGQIYEWANYRFGFAGQRVFSIQEFAANKQNDGAADVFGVGRKRIGQTFGQINRDGTITFLLNEWHAVKELLEQEAVRQGVDDISEVVFSITVAAQLTKKSRVRTDVYTGCSIRGEPFTLTKGGEPVAIQLTLGIGDVE